MSVENRGRRPIPTQLKVLHGTDQPCRINKNEAEPETDRIEPPHELSDEARKHWDLVVRELKSAGLITNLDVVALTMYCEAYATWRHASKQIQKYGTVVKAEKSGFPMQSPYLAIANRAFDQMKGMLTEFGMTPSSRTRVNASPAKASKKNKFAGHAKRPT